MRVRRLLLLCSIQLKILLVCKNLSISKVVAVSVHDYLGILHPSGLQRSVAVDCWQLM